MNFLESLAAELDQIKRRAENIPEQINAALLSLNKDWLAEIFEKLAENRFQLEQQGRPNSKVVIGNGIIQVGDVSGDEILHLEKQGYVILDWTQYRRLLKELGKVVGGNASEAHTLDLQLEAEETRPRGISPSFQFELIKMDRILEMGLRKLGEERAKRDREWQLTLKRWDEEKQLRRQRFRCVKDWPH